MPNKVDATHACRLAAHLSMQRDLGKYCDVCVCVGDKRFLAHKCILSANSTKLDVLIQDAIGQNSSSQDIEIEIQGVSPVGFETLLKQFYTGELKLMPQTVMPVWMTAAYLELPGVVSLCNDYCQRSVTCVSNQTSAEDNKVSGAKNKRANASKKSKISASATTTTFVSAEGQPEVSSSKYSQMTTVTSTLKEAESSISSEPSQQGKSDGNSTVSWTSLQNATGEGFSENNSDVPDYQSVSNTWTSTNYQTVTTEKYTVASNGELVKAEEECVLEDGEIALDAEPHAIPQPSTGVNYAHNSASGNPTPQSLSIIDVNKLSDDKSGGKPACENMMLEVERLRIQHQQLQRLQKQQASMNSPPGTVMHVVPPIPSTPSLTQPASTTDEPPKKKSKKKKSHGITLSAKKNDVSSAKTNHNKLSAPPLIPALPTTIMHTSISQIMDSSQVGSGGRVVPPADFRIITEAYRKSLYVKYPFKQETPMAATCTASELLQRGKSRKRKSSEQNALNNTIRLVLDTMEIVESSDIRVEDALILIMDRFESLRACMNDPAIRRSLLVKVRHSIHCKKWRVKRQMMKEKMDELGETSNEGANEDSLHG